MCPLYFSYLLLRHARRQCDSLLTALLYFVDGIVIFRCAFVTGVTREAGNAYSSGAPGSTSFARSSLLYWVFTGWILIFYSCCLFNDL